MAKRRIKHLEGISKKSKKPGKARKPAGDIISLREDVSTVEPGKPIRESADGSRKGEPAIQVAPSGRKCICCGAALSIYNPDKFCWPCDRAIKEWTNFSWRRTELENDMQPHCLRYVTEKISGKKKTRSVAGEDVSSGSFARAVGRRQIQKR